MGRPSPHAVPTRLRQGRNDAELARPSVAELPAGDRLDLKEVLEAPLAALAAVAGLLVAAERTAGGTAGAVHLHHARAQLPRHPLRPLGIAGPDIGREAVAGVVGDPDRLLITLERAARKSVEVGKRVAGSVGLGGRGINRKKKNK